jgi:hypothetical protein
MPQRRRHDRIAWISMFATAPRPLSPTAISTRETRHRLDAGPRHCELRDWKKLMTVNALLSEEQAMWLLMIAVPRKATLAMTMPISIQRKLTDLGMIQISGGKPRATPTGKAALLKVML